MYSYLEKIDYLGLLKSLEKILALIVLLATAAYAVFGFSELITLDWSQLGTYRIFLEYVLYLAIGVELARLLVDYSLDTLVELLAFVIARKMLLIDGNFTQLLIGVIALVALFASRHYFPRTFREEDKLTKK